MAAAEGEGGRILRTWAPAVREVGASGISGILARVRGSCMEAGSLGKWRELVQSGDECTHCHISLVKTLSGCWERWKISGGSR